MFNFFLKSSHYSLKTLINQIKYFTQKLPIINKIWKNSSFALKGIKEFFQFFGPIAIVVTRFFASILSYLFVVIAVLIINRFINKFTQVDLSQTFIIIIGYFSIFGLNHFILKERLEKSIIFHELFRVPARIIIQSDIYFDELLTALSSFCALFIIGKLFGVSSSVIIMISFLRYCKVIISNALNLWLFKKDLTRKKLLHFINFLTFVPLLAVFAITYFYKMHPSVVILSPVTSLIMIGLTVISFIYIRDYDLYTQIIIDLSRDYEPEPLMSLRKDQLEEISNLKESDQSKSVKYLSKELSGYHLLNEMFFQRHRRLLLKPIKIKAIIFILVLIGLTIIPYLPIDALRKELLDGVYIEKIITALPGVLPFVAYFLFYNESLTKVMFMNCDESLLQYHFYSRSKDLLEMFKLRLIKLLQWNSISMVLFLIWLIIIKAIHNIDFTIIIVLALQIASLWIFFSVHTLFVYYIFQPYTDKYEAKHPVYHIINTAIYVICYSSMKWHPEGVWVAPFFIAVSFLYTILAIVFVYWKAPQTFKVRLPK